MLERISDFLDEELKPRWRFDALIEPILIVVLGVSLAAWSSACSCDIQDARNREHEALIRSPWAAMF